MSLPVLVKVYDLATLQGKKDATVDEIKARLAASASKINGDYTAILALFRANRYGLSLSDVRSALDASDLPAASVDDAAVLVKTLLTLLQPQLVNSADGVPAASVSMPTY